MDDLITWLRAQLDEDERVAGDAAADSPAPWRDETRRDEGGYHGGKIRSSADYTVVHVEDQTPQPEVVAHIVRWDPARVLAEVEAKRRILDAVLAYEEKIDGEWACSHSAEQIAAGQCEATPPNEIHAVRLLAQPYAGRPGWREEWAS